MSANDSSQNDSNYVKYYKKRSKKLWATREKIIRETLKGLSKGASVLDVGCGIGDNYKIMTDFEFNVLGLDNSDKMLHVSRKRNPIGAFQKKDFTKIKCQVQSQYDVVFAQAFIHLFPKSEAQELLYKMLYIAKQRVYVSTTIHDLPSEGIEKKDDGETERYRARYTNDELIKLIDSTILEINRKFSNEKELDKWKWTAKTWYLKDPYGKLWINIQFDRMGIKELYDHQGYIIMNDFFSLLDTEKFINEVESLKDKKPELNSYFRYNDYLGPEKTPVFDRLENVAWHNASLSPLISENMHNLASWFMGGPVMFLKDKVNFKMPGTHPFPPHQDAAAGWAKMSPKHLTIAISIDDTDEENGALYFVPKVHKNQELFSELGDTIPDSKFEKDAWKYTPTKKGDMIVFDSYTPHKSGPNNTRYPRRMIFLTFVAMTPQLRMQHNTPMSLSQEFFSRKRESQPPLDDPRHSQHIAKAKRTPFGKFIVE